MLGKEGDDSLGPQPRCTTCQRCDWADSAGSLMPGAPQLGSTALERRRPAGDSEAEAAIFDFDEASDVLDMP